LSSLETNPLHLYGALPHFDLIEPAHVEPGIRALLAELAVRLDQLEAELQPSWSGLIEPLEAMSERLGYAWGLVGHLMGVQNSDALRDAHAAVQPEVVSFGLRVAQSRPIFEGLEALRDGPEFSELDAPQRRIVETLLREAMHAGVGLDETARTRFNEIQAELAELGTHFSNHVLDATQRFAMSITEPDEMAGVPESLKQLAAQNARENGEEGATAEQGPWRITLDAPVLMPFLEHGENRSRREELYRAYVTRASSGELDNTKIIERILELRYEMATILGFESFAELSIDSKMAPTITAVEELLEQLRVTSIEAARADLTALRDHAKETEEAAAFGSLELWDVAFFAERLREARFDYSEEALRPYFPLPRVLEGLFALAKRLFGVSIISADGDTSVWHPDVRFFRVFGENGGNAEPIAAFFLDPYSRSGEKRGGAWMDECLGLQHMLTRVEYALASGIRNIEWDAVELPSQFMENWCYHRETLIGLSQHVDTGEPLPDELFEKIKAARTYRAGSQMLRQIYFASMDLALHREDLKQSAQDVFDVQRRIAESTTVLPPLDADRFLCSFGHIFAGGYAAGYYSYKWAEVLSADTFSAFEEAGIEDSAAVAEIGRRFRDTVLSLGGGTPPMEVFQAFRGRPPSPAALLRHSGLGSEAT